MKNTFTNKFDISFNPTGRPGKERVRLTVILENVHRVQEAKKILREKGIHTTSISRLD
tara:strand:- start:154 stop:327 length:174 start_codon:yes stop_codon:yes gene_type:complete